MSEEKNLNPEELDEVAGGGFLFDGPSYIGCPYCSQVFSDKNELKNHLINVHPSSSNQPALDQPGKNTFRPGESILF